MPSESAFHPAATAPDGNAQHAFRERLYSAYRTVSLDSDVKKCGMKAKRLLASADCAIREKILKI